MQMLFWFVICMNPCLQNETISLYLPDFVDSFGIENTPQLPWLVWFQGHWVKYRSCLHNCLKCFCIRQVCIFYGRRVIVFKDWFSSTFWVFCFLLSHPWSYFRMNRLKIIALSSHSRCWTKFTQTLVINSPPPPPGSRTPRCYVIEFAVFLLPFSLCKCACIWNHFTIHWCHHICKLSLTRGR